MSTNSQAELNAPAAGGTLIRAALHGAIKGIGGTNPLEKSGFVRDNIVHVITAGYRLW